MPKFHPFAYVKSKVALENIRMKSWVSGVMERVEEVIRNVERAIMIKRKVSYGVVV